VGVAVVAISSEGRRYAFSLGVLLSAVPAFTADIIDTYVSPVRHALPNPAVYGPLFEPRQDPLDLFFKQFEAAEGSASLGTDPRFSDALKWALNTGNYRTELVKKIRSEKAVLQVWRALQASGEKKEALKSLQGLFEAGLKKNGYRGSNVQNAAEQLMECAAFEEDFAAKSSQSIKTHARLWYERLLYSFLGCPFEEGNEADKQRKIDRYLSLSDAGCVQYVCGVICIAYRAAYEKAFPLALFHTKKMQAAFIEGDGKNEEDLFKGATASSSLLQPYSAAADKAHEAAGMSMATIFERLHKVLLLFRFRLEALSVSDEVLAEETSLFKVALSEEERCSFLVGIAARIIEHVALLGQSFFPAGEVARLMAEESSFHIHKGGTFKDIQSIFTTADKDWHVRARAFIFDADVDFFVTPLLRQDKLAEAFAPYTLSQAHGIYRELLKIEEIAHSISWGYVKPSVLSDGLIETCLRRVGHFMRYIEEKLQSKAASKADIHSLFEQLSQRIKLGRSKLSLAAPLTLYKDGKDLSSVDAITALYEYVCVLTHCRFTALCHCIQSLGADKEFMARDKDLLKTEFIFDENGAVRIPQAIQDSIKKAASPRVKSPDMKRTKILDKQMKQSLGAITEQAHRFDVRGGQMHTSIVAEQNLRKTLSIGVSALHDGRVMFDHAKKFACLYIQKSSRMHEIMYLRFLSVLQWANDLVNLVLYRLRAIHSGVSNFEKTKLSSAISALVSGKLKSIFVGSAQDVQTRTALLKEAIKSYDDFIHILQGALSKDDLREYTDYEH